jgi:spore coat protein JB
MDRERRNNINVNMLKEIMTYDFSVLETVLYLNTHPEDERVLELHNRYADRLDHLTEEYQERYTLLNQYYPEADYPWQWIDEPWPWEIEY